MIQTSGLRAEIDLERPVGDRLVDLKIGNEPVGDERIYRVGTNSFLAEGGDLYSTFVGKEWIRHDERTLAEVVIAYFEERDRPVPMPEAGRIVRSLE